MVDLFNAFAHATRVGVNQRKAVTYCHRMLPTVGDRFYLPLYYSETKYPPRTCLSRAAAICIICALLVFSVFVFRHAVLLPSLSILSPVFVERSGDLALFRFLAMLSGLVDFEWEGSAFNYLQLVAGLIAFAALSCLPMEHDNEST